MELKLHTLRPAPGSKKRKKRVGRGEASGWGKTAGRGHKGQKARSGGGKGPYFEGGQMPLQRRLPKRGFRNPNRKEYAIINVGDIPKFFREGEEITPEILLKRKIVKKLKSGVKLLGTGEIKGAYTIKVHKASRRAIEKIEKAGGKVEVINV